MAFDSPNMKDSDLPIIIFVRKSKIERAVVAAAYYHEPCIAERIQELIWYFALDCFVSYSVVDLLKNVLRPKTNRYRKFVTCNILT